MGANITYLGNMSGEMELAVARIKLMDALQSPTPEKLDKLVRVYNLAETPEILKLAVEVGTFDIVKRVLDLYRTYNRNINEQDAEGNTALHIGVARNRKDVVLLLLSQPDIDDVIVNDKAMTAVDLAPNQEMEREFTEAQNQFLETTALRLRHAFHDQNLQELQEIYSNPRVPELLDINGLDPDTGMSVLHDCAAKNNLDIVRFILDHGGDPLARDKHGRLASEVTKNEAIRRVINDAAKSQAILTQTIQSNGMQEPPTMSGYLKKWTNFTSGYKLRWFVLKNNTLYYYKSSKDSADMYRSCLNLRMATVKLDSSEKNKFEIRTPTTKLHLRATHPVETNRWVWALQNSITRAKDEERWAQESKQPKTSLELRTHQRNSLNEAGSPTSQPASQNVRSESIKSSQHSRKRSGMSDTDRASTGDGGIFINDLAVNEAESSSVDADDDPSYDSPPVSHDAVEFQLRAVNELLESIEHQSSDAALIESMATAQNSINAVIKGIASYANYHKQQLHRLQLKLDRSESDQRIWAQNYRDLELAQEKLEGQLYALRHDANVALESDDEFFDTIDQFEEPNDRDAHEGSRDESDADAFDFEDAHDPHETTKTGTSSSTAEQMPVQTSVTESGAPQQRNSRDDVAIMQTQTETTTNRAAAPCTPCISSTSNAKSGPGLTHQPHLGTQAAKVAERDILKPSVDQPVVPLSYSAVSQIEKLKTMYAERSFVGYEDPPRQRLAISNDNRSRISLWGVLKSLIGKDMTRMTLPVTFNECTSLLQRSAEDMEYVDLLDKAAGYVDDGGLRMAYVSAFAISSYSSTINRVAKPFNPLLGETYEYCRPDLGFRLMAEQVSHHPPIGALIAESPRWDFYGESNVESKFYGRSFDIRPLGLWYLSLRLDNGGNLSEELYTFRKVTSSVVGIMIGNPVVDNHGEMVVTNHTTGVVAKIELKSRGWRGSGAYVLSGVVRDRLGKELYQIGGAWNSKIWCKRAGQKGKLILWQVHERPAAPFNLTPFAITLNALPDRLKPWLPPTDTRLRPDQRAMEEGRYDEAADEKHRVEEKQRAARRKREEEGRSYHPQWFTIAKHPITHKNYYKPINDYWKLRGELKLKDKGDIF